MKKNLTILILIVIFIISPFVVWLISRGNHVRYSVSAPFAKSVSFPYLKSDNELYYYSGSSFIKYDLDTQKSTNLSEKYLLPEVYRVEWGDGMVAFAAKNYNAGDNLYPMLINAGLSTNSIYWWAMNLGDGTFSLIGSADSIGGVLWQKDSKNWIADFRPRGDYNETVIRNGSVGGETSVIGKYAEFNSLLWSDKEKFLGLFVSDTTSNINSYKIPSGSPENIYSSLRSTSFSINKDGNSYLYTVLPEDYDNHDNGGKLVFKNSDEEPKIIDRGYFVGNYVWSNYTNNWVALSTEKNSSEGYIFDGRKIKSLEVKLLADSPRVNHLQIGSNFIVLVDSDHKAYVASSDKNFVNKFKTSVEDSQDETLLIREALKPLVKDNYTITYFRGTSSYQIMIYSNPFSKYRDEALNLMRNDYELDPNQLDIEWLVGRGVDPTK